MRASDIRAMSEAELEAAELNTVEELWQARNRQFAGELRDTSRLRKLRRQLARIRTVRRERALGIEPRGQGGRAS